MKKNILKKLMLTAVAAISLLGGMVITGCDANLPLEDITVMTTTTQRIEQPTASPDTFDEEDQATTETSVTTSFTTTSTATSSFEITSNSSTTTIAASDVTSTTTTTTTDDITSTTMTTTEVKDFMSKTTSNSETTQTSSTTVKITNSSVSTSQTTESTIPTLTSTAKLTTTTSTTTITMTSNTKPVTSTTITTSNVEATSTTTTNNEYVVFKPSTHYIHKSTCHWAKVGQVERIENTSNIICRRCSECRPEMKIEKEYIDGTTTTVTSTTSNGSTITTTTTAATAKPEYNLTEWDITLLRRIVSSEYGADWVSVEEKAKIVAAVMAQVNDPRYPDTVLGCLNASCTPWGFKPYKEDYYMSDSIIAAVDYYFDNKDTVFANWTANSWWGDGKANHFYYQ